MNAEDRAVAGGGLSLEFGSDEVAVLEFDQPWSEHNRFTPDLLERFEDLLREIRSAADQGTVVGVVIASGKPDSFVVGVDVAAIAGVENAAAGTTAARQGQLVFQTLAELPVPTVAAINGKCLGGATEMALACDYRLAADSTAVEIGLPEVNLGIFPGFGGTQRLPRLLSLERALRMILTGSSVDVGRARRYGLVDAVVPPPVLVREARRWARGEAGPGGGKRDPGGGGKADRRGWRPPEDRPLPRRLRRAFLEGNPIGRALVFRQARGQVMSRTGGHYPAPLRALEAVREGLARSLGEGLKLEAELVGPLIVSDVAHSLMGLFFLRQAARKRAFEGRAVLPPAGSEAAVGDVGGSSSSPFASATPRTVDKIGLLGAGVMGGGIAQLAAYNEIAVRLKDIDADALREAMGIAHRRLQERRRAGRLTERDVEHRLGLISPTLEYTGFRHADLVVEAVVENLEVKHAVLRDVEACVGPETVLATNTSSLTLEQLAPALSDPTRLVGLHFFNPVHKMQLVEIVQGELSSPTAVATAAALAARLGKVPVIVRDAPGFWVNRVLMPYLNEGLLLFESGVPIASIDDALEDFGMPMGPLRLLDEIGLDVAAHVAEVLGEAFGDRVPASTVIAKMRDAERLGRKGGRGFYLYGDGEPRPDPAAVQLMDRAARAEMAPAEEIVDRCILALLNEACHALAEDVVSSPQQGDLALVLGTGFAPFRGGIFRYAQSRGLDEVRERLAGLAERHGTRFEPAPLLVGVCEQGRTFYPENWPLAAA